MRAAGIIATEGAKEVITNVPAAMAAHAAAGAACGAFNTAVSGGDLGQNMVTSAVSAGLAKGIGTFIPTDPFSSSSANFIVRLASHAAIGGVTGGITAELYGGNFGQGFEQGAMMGGMGYMFNEGGGTLREWWNATALPWLKQTFSGAYGDVNVMAGVVGGGYLVDAKGKIYPYYCGGVGGGISATGGGSSFVPGEWFLALQISGAGPIAPTVQFGRGSQSGPFSEAGVAAGGAWSLTVCRISRTPIYR